MRSRGPALGIALLPLTAPVRIARPRGLAVFPLTLAGSSSSSSQRAALTRALSCASSQASGPRPSRAVAAAALQRRHRYYATADRRPRSAPVDRCSGSLCRHELMPGRQDQSAAPHAGQHQQRQCANAPHRYLPFILRFSPLTVVGYRGGPTRFVTSSVPSRAPQTEAEISRRPHSDHTPQIHPPATQGQESP